MTSSSDEEEENNLHPGEEGHRSTVDGSECGGSSISSGSSAGWGGATTITRRGEGSASTSMTSLKPPPEGRSSSSSSIHVAHAGDGNDDDDNDDCEIEIEELDFSNHDRNDGNVERCRENNDDSPASRIRAALSTFVATAKRRKKRMMEKEKQRGREDGEGGDDIRQLREDEDEMGAGAGAGADDGKGTNDDEGRAAVEQALISRKRRPIQVVMKWMDSFQDNERIQLICLQALPTILEDTPNRETAQSEGLASVLFYDMTSFPSNSMLQLTALHALVVLLRPLGGNLGTSPSSSSARRRQGDVILEPPPPSPTINSALPLSSSREPRWEENGVRVMLDAMRRHSSDGYLQAMGCWAMVNAALYPTLKICMLRLGSAYAITNAMMLHPNVEAVQFRGLFALINLVIPVNKSKDGDGSSINAHIYQIVRLTILAMKNFHVNKSILNRGCLVLRNLSITPAFVKVLAHTSGCADMLLHCRKACPRDALVQRSTRLVIILMQRAIAENRDGVEGDPTSDLVMSSPSAAPEESKN